MIIILKKRKEIYFIIFHFILQQLHIFINTGFNIQTQHFKTKVTIHIKTRQHTHVKTSEYTFKINFKHPDSKIKVDKH